MKNPANILMPWPPVTADFIFHESGKNDFRLRSMLPKTDVDTLHGWFSGEHARFWPMPDKSLAGLHAFYKDMQQSPHIRAFLGYATDQPAFLIECYFPERDRVGEHYPVLPGDLGMHLFIAPPTVRAPQFTHDVFRFVMNFMFMQLGARRIVVEPDVNNARIHVLNRDMGFHIIRQARFLEKDASIAVCTRDDFETSQPMESSS